MFSPRIAAINFLRLCRRIGVNLDLLDILHIFDRGLLG